jgi:hypothetical protein
LLFSAIKGKQIVHLTTRLRAPADCDHRFQLIATKRSD